MHNNLLKTLLATATLCACSLAVAQGQQDRGVPGDRYGYDMHNGRRDPFTDGAHGIRKADPYTDGALGTRKSDPFTDGANSAASGMTLAGMDRTGVSAPPAHSA